MAGITENVLEVIAHVTDQQKKEMQQWLNRTPIEIIPIESEYALDICVD